MILICPDDSFGMVVPIANRFFSYAREWGTFSPQHFIKFWTNNYANNTGVLLVDLVDDEIKGFIGVVFCFEPWTGDLIAEEVCWYSEGNNGVRLLKRAQQIAKNVGAKIFYLNHLENDKMEKMKKFYTKNGFKRTYHKYTKEL